MPFRALATDYDGTLADHGRVAEPTWAALERLRDSGIGRILVTGRELEELLSVCPRMDLFDRVIAENGAWLYRPADRTEQPLAPPPSPTLVAALQARGVGPIATGRAIVATWEPHRPAVEAAIAELQLDLVVIANKRALMILPPGIDKASGLEAALDELGISLSATVAVGDAENDAPMLRACGLGVAVANALAELKQVADWVTPSERGEGVIELVDRWLGPVGLVKD
jgi:hydroxymethylpyrimidine pyrophosphatase-like HAD family hydrolase